MGTKTDAPEALSASALWASDSPDDWRAALDAYAQRRDALNHEKLTRLDEWFFHRLTVDVRARTPPCMTAKELVDMVDWTMTRGKVRPNLLNFAKAHSEATVEEWWKTEYKVSEVQGNNGVGASNERNSDEKAFGRYWGNRRSRTRVDFLLTGGESA